MVFGVYFLLSLLIIQHQKPQNFNNHTPKHHKMSHQSKQKIRKMTRKHQNQSTIPESPLSFQWAITPKTFPPQHQIPKPYKSRSFGPTGLIMKHIIILHTPLLSYTNKLNSWSITRRGYLGYIHQIFQTWMEENEERHYYVFGIMTYWHSNHHWKNLPCQYCQYYSTKTMTNSTPTNFRFSIRRIINNHNNKYTNNLPLSILILETLVPIKIETAMEGRKKY